MSTYRVSLAFARLPDGALDVFTGNVIMKMTGNVYFPEPRVPMEDLTYARNQFALACEAAVNGGKQATANKNERRVAFARVVATGSGLRAECGV